MKIIRFSGQYKKDAKRYRHQSQKMMKVVEILQKLRDEILIPAEFKHIR